MFVLLSVLHMLQWNVLAAHHVAGPLVMIVRGYWSVCTVTWHGADAFANNCVTLFGR